MGKPIFDPLSGEPPTALIERPIYASEKVPVNTYRVMADPLALRNRWFDPRAGRLSSGNEVTYLPSGAETFAAMAAAMKTAVAKGHFIYLLGWFLKLDVPLAGAETCKVLFERAAAAGAQVRAMLWRNVVMGGDTRPRRVWIIAPRDPGPLTLGAARIAVKVVEEPANPPEPPLLHRFEAVLSQFDVPGDRAPMIFDGSPNPWWSPVPVAGGRAAHARTQNSDEVDFISGRSTQQYGNGLSSPEGAGHCAAILDHHHPVAGAHHQKILVVNGTQGLIAFCGGVDINADRLSFLYDVHCRIRGPAAAAVLQIFNERWEEHPDRVAVEQGKAHLGKSVVAPAPLKGHGVDVQIARTYADGNRPRPSLTDINPTADDAIARFARNMDPFKGYAFAPSGVDETWRMVKAAIATARRFIYLENQYFVSEQLAHELAKAVPRVQHITLLLQWRSDVDTDDGQARTRKCIQILRNADPNGEKVRFFCKVGGLSYVHSKVFIFDDEYAVITSANGNRRSFTCDTEVAAGVYDSSRGDEPALRFARRLRIKLWAPLLDMDTPDGHAQLVDGVAAVAHWVVRRPKAMVADLEAVFKSNPPKSTPVPDWEWDFARDPFPGTF